MEGTDVQRKTAPIGEIQWCYHCFNFTFISLDRPAIGAGRSYVGVFGDEVKYFPEEKFTNLLKAVRGFRVKYGDSVWYRSRTLTTDMPNPNHLGEYDWILKLAKHNDKKKKDTADAAYRVSFYNETKKRIPGLCSIIMS